MCAPTKQNAGFWLKSSKSLQVLHILLYGQAQLLFFSHWRGTLFAWRILYACTHGEVICKATSIFRHKYQHGPRTRPTTWAHRYPTAQQPAFSVTNLYDCTHGEKFLIARYSSPFWFFFWFLHPLICTILTDLQKHPFLSTKSVGLCKNPNFPRWEQVSA